jgi:ring-1,2-phenylacetyl-CoA epoxidase subunit PaaD
MQHEVQQVREEILEALKEVKDPEIPSVSVVELGMFYDAQIEDGQVIVIKMLPTFTGCPALDIISRDIRLAVQSKISWAEEVKVEFVFDENWTTERISEEGRQNLKEYGIAPPPVKHNEGDPWHVDCPYCGSTYTTMENIFGPAACRSILYCRSCKNPFEAMKPVSNI